ncbi:MAG TPA: hypothetical protein DDY53_06620 [Clostridiales bacterium]|nr:hypothetical protein [Clostridiales bacterium]
MNSDLVIKYLLINIFTYLIALKISNTKNIKYIQSISIIIGSVIVTIIYSILKEYLNFTLLFMIAFFIQIMFLTGIINKNTSIIITNLLANAIAYAIFIVASIIELIPMIIFKIKISTINFMLIALIDIILMLFFLKMKRLKNGLVFLNNNVCNNYIDIIVINISMTIILAYCILGNYYGNLTMNLTVSFVILTIIMFIMIQKTLILYYKQKLLEKTMADYEEEIKQKDEIIKELSEEKFKISKVNHEFYNRQKSLEKAVKDFINNTSTEMGNELTIINKINNLSKEYSNKMEKIKQVEKLPLTDVEEIDEMFKYMQSECIKNNIDFRLKIEGNIISLINNIIEKDRLVTLIRDHLRDAIIAINSGTNKFKSIIAILGIKDKYYEFCVYDTGVEFEIETLLKLGLEPVTTHKNTGGTGIGFISTFETINKCKASLIIQEKNKENTNNYTKAVIIRFDGKKEYRIKSYRANEIKKQVKDNRIIIEK